MNNAAFSALLSHWRRQPLQLVTLILGLALATGLWSAVQAINGQARASYAEAARQLGNTRFSSLVSPDGSMALDRYVQLRLAGWQVSPVLEGRIRVGTASVTLLGVDFLSYPLELQPSAGQADVLPVDVLTGPGRLFTHSATAETFGDAPVPAPLIVTSQIPIGMVLTDIGTAEQLLNRQGQISRMLVLPDQPTGLKPLKSIAPDLVFKPPEDDGDIARLTDSFHLNLTAFGLLSFAVGLFIVHGTVGLAFHQRRGMFRTLRALGLPLRVLTRLLLTELILLALLAGGLGLILGYLVAAALIPDVAATLRGLYGAPVAGELSLRPVWFASGLGMALAGALVAGAQGLWQLHRLPILSAPGLQSWRAATAQHARICVVAAVALLASGGISVWVLDGLLAGFALLAGLLLGAALLLPPLMSVAIDRIGRFCSGAVCEWVWADLRSQLPGLSLALMALLLALATNIGVGTMVSSFRLTFTGWLDQRLASELYVTARSDEEGRAIADWLQTRSDAVLPIRHGDSRVAGQPVRIYGIIDHSTYRDHWPLIDALPDIWDRLHNTGDVLINEQLARRAELWTGDTVALAPGWSTRIAGIYSDYGNPTGQAITAMAELLAHMDNIADRRFGVRVPPDQVAALSGDLRASFDLPANAIIDQASLKARSLSIFEKTFVVTGALNVLTLGVASFAILTSLLTLWTLRLPQLAPVWALGLSRRQLARLELLRSVALAGMTAILALPLGIALAWILLAVINVEAFGWRLPMYLFPWDWVRLAALSILAGAIAAILPVRRLVTTPPSEFLKVFSNER